MSNPNDVAHVRLLNALPTLLRSEPICYASELERHRIAVTAAVVNEAFAGDAVLANLSEFGLATLKDFLQGNGYKPSSIKIHERRFLRLWEAAWLTIGIPRRNSTATFRKKIKQNIRVFIERAATEVEAAAAANLQTSTAQELAGLLENLRSDKAIQPQGAPGRPVSKLATLRTELAAARYAAAKQFHRRLLEDQTPTSLMRYFRDVFLPDRLASAATDTRNNYQSALQLFCRFIFVTRKPTRITLGELTDADVSGFYRWLVVRGNAVSSARISRNMIRAILNHADPKRFGKPSKGKHSQSRSIAKPGTLLDFFRGQYAPQSCLAGSTIENYEESIRLLNRFVDRQVEVGQLNDEIVGQFLAWLKAKGNKATTINKHRRQLKAIWRRAFELRLVKKRCRLRRLKEIKRIPVAWTPEEFARVLATAAETEGQFHTIPAGVFWTGLLLTLYWTGARISAVMALRVKDVDFDRGIVRLRGETQKQKADQDFVLPPNVLLILRQFRRQVAPDAKLFPWPYDLLGNVPGRSFKYRRLNIEFKRIIAQAGLPKPERVFHMIRRTVATQIANVAGEAVASRHLGHSSLQVTRASYLDTSQLDAFDMTKIIPAPVSIANEGGVR